MPDREKVIKGLEVFNKNRICLPHLIPWDEITDAIAMLKEQEELINELLELGYPHNFQHEAPWVVDYLYSLTEIIKKAFNAKEGR